MLADPRLLSIVGAAMQLALAVAVAGALALARRTAGVRTGAYFVAAHGALALALVAILTRNVLGPDATPGAPNVLLRLLVGVYLGCKLAFYLGLALGTSEVIGEQPPRALRALALPAVALAAIGAALYSPALQRSLPFQGALAALVTLTGVRRLRRADAAVRTAGARALAAALVAYAALSLPYLLGLRYSLPYAPGRALWFVIDRSSALDLVAQLLLGAAMIVWLVEQRREVDRRDRTQRDALQREETATVRLETLGRVSATVAHELNNPLTVVLGTAEHLLQTSTDATQRADLELLLREALRCRHVARDLLLFARDAAPVAAPVAAATLVHDALAAVRLQGAAAGVRLEAAIAEPSPLVRADAAAIPQALINLLRNAIDASPRGAVVRVSVAGDGTTVRFAVEDAGAGIPPQIRARLFEPFVTSKPEGRGTGLGMAIVRGIVSRHGGSLEVISVPERAVGTCVTVQLPQVGADGDATAAAPTPPSGVPAARPAATGHGTALIVDDEPGIRRLLARALERRGLAVHAASDGVEGQSILATLPPTDVAVVFCDLRMPRMDGRAFTTWLAAVHPALVPRTVLLTGDTVTEDVRALAERVGCRLLAKPFRQQDLDAVLEDVAASPTPPAHAA